MTGTRRGVEGVDELLFAVTLDRVGTSRGDDTIGSALLRTASGGLHRVGKTREVRPLPARGAQRSS